MNQIVTGAVGADVALSSAMLLYGKPNSDPEYATVHEILTDPKTLRPIIGAGRPLTCDALLGAVRSLAKEASPATEFLPATVLGLSMVAVTWWCPPTQRRVFFECEELGNRSAVVPHPGLIFRAGSNGFRVFAVKGSERPQADTPIFEPPYFNTWDRGSICIGTASVPKRIDVASIAGWEAGFFDSAFTHPNVGGKRLTYPNGEFAFWRDMLDGKFSGGFPEEVLVPMKVTAKQIVCGGVA
jgi:PRTRC genetic system protein B